MKVVPNTMYNAYKIFIFQMQSNLRDCLFSYLSNEFLKFLATWKILELFFSMKGWRVPSYPIQEQFPADGDISFSTGWKTMGPHFRHFN